MSNKELLAAAMRQSALELGCDAEDFTRAENIAVVSRPHEGARKYLELPFDCQLVSYGNNVVAAAREEWLPFVRRYIDKYGPVRSFETPQMHILNDEWQRHGCRACFMAVYYLPDVNALCERDCGYTLRVLTPEAFAPYYLPAFGNAICKVHSDRDVLAVGAFDGDELIGLAGASADCETMWQIGVDVLPAYRQKGVGSAVTARLATEILARGKVPFYCAAWSNVRSARNAIRSGFRPAWVELTAKPAAFVGMMNGAFEYHGI